MMVVVRGSHSGGKKRLVVSILIFVFFHLRRKRFSEKDPVGYTNCGVPIFFLSSPASPISLTQAVALSFFVARYNRSLFCFLTLGRWNETR